VAFGSCGRPLDRLHLVLDAEVASEHVPEQLQRLVQQLGGCVLCALVEALTEPERFDVIDGAPLTAGTFPPDSRGSRRIARLARRQDCPSPQRLRARPHGPCRCAGIHPAFAAQISPS
jgi:hypothetical protein